MAQTVLLESRELQPRIIIVDNGHISQKPIYRDLTVGRSTETVKADLSFQHNYVSRRHGILGMDEKGTYYVDTGSKNGTFYNGIKLIPEQKQYLFNGDVLHIYNGNPRTENDVVVIVYVTDYPETFAEHTIHIPQNSSIAEINIGRSSNTGITLGGNTISANHASFFTAQNGWAIVDHNSKNGVYLNNLRIDRPKYLRVGDCIRISNVHFFFLGSLIVYQSSCGQQVDNPAASGKTASEGSLDIHIVERSVWQRARKLMLLQNINMTIEAGEMVLILGGSGAGKTTFMNAVMGYEKAEGKIMHGDTDVYEDFKSMKYKIGFVPQQDLLRGSDTVYDTLDNAADMKLPGNISKRQKKDRIENVLNTLGLQRERNSLVSKLSGGQRKRLSIAVEYIADPSLFFLDEPDSGLDGIMAKTLMQNLRTIANEGKIVMVISHGPDRAADLFDKVIVLAKSVKDNCGHLAFFGTVKEAYDFFDATSLEGVVKRINREDEGGDGLSDFYIEKYDKRIG
ncbi:MAG: ATP-binding cassette domain-containing protein [Clostridia bacterium]|nr:ATP-binding cassette domain-containing protein [Clostridia bacterium]